MPHTSGIIFSSLSGWTHLFPSATSNHQSLIFCLQFILVLSDLFCSCLLLCVYDVYFILTVLLCIVFASSLLVCIVNKASLCVPASVNKGNSIRLKWITPLSSTCVHPLRKRPLSPGQERTSAWMPSLVTWSHQEMLSCSSRGQPSLPGGQFQTEREFNIKKRKNPYDTAMRQRIYKHCELIMKTGSKEELCGPLQ